MSWTDSDVVKASAQWIKQGICRRFGHRLYRGYNISEKKSGYQVEILRACRRCTYYEQRSYTLEKNQVFHVHGEDIDVFLWAMEST